MHRLGAYGFTVTELLTTIAIATLLLGVGIPSLTAIARNSAQVSSSNELLSSLNHARDIAITRNVRMTVCPSATGADCESAAWDRGWIVFEDLDNNRSVGAQETIERVSGRTGDTTVTTHEFDSYVIFRPNGRAMGADIRDNAGVFTFCDERGSSSARMVIIGLSGRPRIAKTAANGSRPAC